MARYISKYPRALGPRVLLGEYPTDDIAQAAFEAAMSGDPLHHLAFLLQSRGLWITGHKIERASEGQLAKHILHVWTGVERVSMLYAPPGGEHMFPRSRWAFNGNGLEQVGGVHDKTRRYELAAWIANVVHSLVNAMPKDGVDSEKLPIPHLQISDPKNPNLFCRAAPGEPRPPVSETPSTPHAHPSSEQSAGYLSGVLPEGWPALAESLVPSRGSVPSSSGNHEAPGEDFLSGVLLKKQFSPRQHLAPSPFED